MTDCKHTSFRANVDVNRILESDTQDATPKAFMAEVHIQCVDCGEPFEFVGLPCGLMWHCPTVDPSSQELRAPIRPKGWMQLMSMPVGLVN